MNDRLLIINYYKCIFPLAFEFVYLKTTTLFRLFLHDCWLKEAALLFHCNSCQQLQPLTSTTHTLHCFSDTQGTSHPLWGKKRYLKIKIKSSHLVNKLQFVEYCGTTAVITWMSLVFLLAWHSQFLNASVVFCSCLHFFFKTCFTKTQYKKPHRLPLFHTHSHHTAYRVRIVLTY